MTYNDISALYEALNQEDLTTCDMIIFCRKIVRMWNSHNLDMQSDIITPFLAIEDETGHLMHNVEEGDSRPIPVSRAPTTLTGDDLRKEKNDIMKAYGGLFKDGLSILKQFLDSRRA